MSKSAVVIALLVMIALGAGAWFALKQNGTTPITTPDGVLAIGEKVIPFDASEIRLFNVVSRESRDTQTVWRDDAGNWWHSFASPSLLADYPHWPVEASRARGFVRLLSETRATGQPGDQSKSIQDTDGMLQDWALYVIVESATGARVTLGADSPPLGGSMSVVTFDSGSMTRARIDDSLYNLLTKPGPSAWRTVTIAPSQESLTGIIAGWPTGAMELARRRGGWRMIQPVGAPAEANAVGELLTAIDQITVADFLDDEERELATEQAELTLVAGGQRRRVVLGGPSDSTGARLYARIHDDRLGEPRLVSLEVSALGGVSRDPARFISRRSAESRPPDIGSLALDGAGDARFAYRRDLDGWLDTSDADAEARLGPGARLRVEELIEFLCEAPAAEVGITDIISAPVAPADGVTITLGSLGGNPLEVLRARAIRDGSMIEITNGRVWRRYTPTVTPELLRIALAELTVIPAPPGPGEDPDK